jgi:hypothetical protein
MMMIYYFVLSYCWCVCSSSEICRKLQRLAQLQSATAGVAAADNKKKGMSDELLVLEAERVCQHHQTAG